MATDEFVVDAVFDDSSRFGQSDSRSKPKSVWKGEIIDKLPFLRRAKCKTKSPKCCSWENASSSQNTISQSEWRTEREKFWIKIEFFYINRNGRIAGRVRICDFGNGTSVFHFFHKRRKQFRSRWRHAIIIMMSHHLNAGYLFRIQRKYRIFFAHF